MFVDSIPSKGMRFFASEALDEALRFYRECRELAVDLVAESDDKNAGAESGARPAVRPDADTRGFPSLAAAASTPTAGLVRAEFNLGMALTERKRYGDAVAHLSGVGDGCRKLARMAETATSAAGPGDTAWEEPFLRENASDLGGLYASSLAMLGECRASSSPRSGTPPSDAQAPAALGLAAVTPAGRLGIAVETLARAVDSFLALGGGGGDPGGALDPLERLARVLRLPGGEAFLGRAEALCDKVLGALVTRRGSHGGAGGGADRDEDRSSHSSTRDSDRDVTGEVEGMREEIRELRRRHGRGESDVAGENDGHGRDGTRELAPEIQPSGAGDASVWQDSPVPTAKGFYHDGNDGAGARGYREGGRGDGGPECRRSPSPPSSAQDGHADYRRPPGFITVGPGPGPGPSSGHRGRPSRRRTPFFPGGRGQRLRNGGGGSGAALGGARRAGASASQPTVASGQLYAESQAGARDAVVPGRVVVGLAGPAEAFRSRVVDVPHPHPAPPSPRLLRRKRAAASWDCWCCAVLLFVPAVPLPCCVAIFHPSCCGVSRELFCYAARPFHYTSVERLSRRLFPLSKRFSLPPPALR